MVNYLLPQSSLTINAAPLANALSQYRQGMNQQFQAERQADWRKEDMDWRQSQVGQAQANADRSFGLQERRFGADQSYRNAQLGMQQKRFGLDQRRFGAEQDARKEALKSQLVKNAAGVAQLVASEADPAKQADMWQQFVAVHPRVAASLPPELRNDPRMGSQFIMARARGVVDPLAARLNKAKIGALEAKAIGGGNKPPSGYAWNTDGSLRAIEGGPATKLGGDVAGRIALMNNGLRELPKARRIFIGGGNETGLPRTHKPPREIGIGGRANMLLNRGQAGEARRIVQTLVEAQLRALTGAAATPEETERLMNFYGPTSTDTPQTMMRKLSRLEATIKESITLLRTGRMEQPGPSQSTSNADPLGLRKQHGGQR